MSSTLTKASVVGGAVLYLFAHFGSSSKAEILLSTLGILFFCVFTLVSVIPAAILNFIWRRLRGRGTSALAFPLIIFVTTASCIFLGMIGRSDLLRAASVASFFGLWLASISATLAYLSVSESGDVETAA